MSHYFKRVNDGIKTHNKQLFILQFVVYGSLVLYFGRDLFIPVSYAVLISFILFPFCRWLERKGLSKGMAIFIGLLLLLLLIVSIALLMAYQLSLFIKEWPAIQVKLQALITELSIFTVQKYAITKEQQDIWIHEISNGSIGYIFTFLKNTLSASVRSSIVFILIPVYAALFLYYRNLLIQAIAYIFPGERKEETKRILYLSVDAYYNFIKGMAIVYLIVGLLNSLGLLMLGVPHAFFFGFITSILTFIPYVGIIIGSLLPIGMAWITFNSIWYPLGVVLVFVIVQYLEANVIFPLAVSNRLSINPLATILAITLGGIFWGVSGMILFVPFLAILKLIADRHPSMRLLSLLASNETINP
ncbi:AI-2E family transporter [Chryseotalea sanaruensis]|uniref:AI-2E family transporter n=1 Tax=Chryseotalea sanaruensis TaxID=2482724 RepID=A0A401U5B1_9BACT|nr:AI-2E family transporter [Chryseotalea sanaruensis]GCC50020.1 AI-2E family transporter [Chryseotalea sanaruensis]